MAILGITGGIATGKSTFVRELMSRANVKFFDSDRTAHELLVQPEVLEEIESVFGSAVFSGKGIIDRKRLREIVFRDPSERLKLEKILHPRIRDRWMQEAATARAAGEWYAVDIPLLFEKGVESVFDTIVVVACSAATQWARLLGERGLSAEVASQILSAQMPLEHKVAKADHVVWSDAPLARLYDQVDLLLRCWGLVPPGCKASSSRSISA